MPATSPTLNEIVRLIVQIGGYLGRKFGVDPRVKMI